MKKHLLLLTTLCTAGLSSAQQTWYEIPTGTSKQLNTIDFASSSVGYIGGNDSLLLKTTDGGQTWTEVSYTGVTFYPDGEHIVNLEFVSETVGYMTVGPYSGAYKTTDGGQTWQALTLSTNLCYNEALWFWDENNGFVGGSGCFQAELIDRLSGGTWSAATISSSGLTAENRVTDIDFLDADFGLASSRGGRMLRTTDGGLTWDSITTPFTDAFDGLAAITSVQILNDTLCYATYDHNTGGYGIMVSTDAGLTWDDDMNAATFYYPEMFGSEVTADGTLFMGGGPSWDTTGIIFNFHPAIQFVFMQPVDFRIRDIGTYGNSVVFAAGEHGYLVTNTPPGSLGVNETHATASVQVFPNPASGEVTILLPEKYSPNPAYTVLSASGSIVQAGTLDNDRLNVAQLAAGVYIVRITDGDRAYTSRVVRQ